MNFFDVNTVHPGSVRCAPEVRAYFSAVVCYVAAVRLARSFLCVRPSLGAVGSRVVCVLD